MCNNQFAVHLKLTQPYKSTILQFKKRIVEGSLNYLAVFCPILKLPYFSLMCVCVCVYNNYSQTNF